MKFPTVRLFETDRFFHYQKNSHRHVYSRQHMCLIRMWNEPNSIILEFRQCDKHVYKITVRFSPGTFIWNGWFFLLLGKFPPASLLNAALMFSTYVDRTYLNYTGIPPMWQTWPLKTCEISPGTFIWDMLLFLFYENSPPACLFKAELVFSKAVQRTYHNDTGNPRILF